jgi:hypothetical protein
MDYFGIIKKSYYLSIKHKFLWIFGILAGGYGGFKSFGSGLNFPTSGSNWSNAFNKSLSASNSSISWGNFVSAIVAIMAVLGVIALILFIFSLISQGALIGSTSRLSKNEKTDFWFGFGIGWHNFWRVLGVGIIFLLMVLVSLIVLIVPVAVLIVAKAYAIAIILGILLFFVCLAFWILIAIIAPYSLRVVVLDKLGIFTSIREALHFFRKNWGEVIVMYLLLFAIGIGFGIALLLAIMIVGGVLLAIGLGFYLASATSAIVYGLIIGLAFLITLVIISGAYNSFSSNVLTLTYLKLKK